MQTLRCWQPLQISGGLFSGVLCFLEVGDRFQSILPYSRSCKVFHKQTCRGPHITIIFAFLADNAGSVPFGLLQLDVYTGFFGNSCGVFSQFSYNGRKTFLFSNTNFNRDSITKGILSYSFLRFSAAAIRRRRGSSAPYPLRFIAFISGKAAKKQHPLRCRLPAKKLCTAQVTL